jgi:uncharacterized protein
VIVVAAELGDGRMHLTVDGHGNHAEDGRICAAVSAVVQAAVLGLQAIEAEFPQHIAVDIKETTQ